jgi:hypothetical protein
MDSPAVRGYLVVMVEEATGKNQRSEFVWDNSATLEAFVKVEIRGGPKNIKDQTRKVGLQGDTITWHQQLVLEVLEGSNELRLMLCREKFQGTKRGTSVIAACGIYVNDILDAAPIDKYFEMFKPNAGGEGGYVRICIKFTKDQAGLNQLLGAGEALYGPGSVDAVDAALSGETATEVAKKVQEMNSQANKKKRGFPLKRILLLGVVSAGAFLFIKKK